MNRYLGTAASSFFCVVLLNNVGCGGWFTEVPIAKTYPTVTDPKGDQHPGVPDEGSDSTEPHTAIMFCKRQRDRAREKVAQYEGFGITLGAVGLIGAGSVTATVAAASGSKGSGLTPAQGALSGIGIAGFGTLTGLGIYLLARASSARSAYWLTNGAIAAMYGNTGLPGGGGSGGPSKGGAAPGGAAPADANGTPTYKEHLKQQQDWQSCGTALVGIAASDAQVDSSVAGALKPGGGGSSGGGGSQKGGAAGGGGPTMDELANLQLALNTDEGKALFKAYFARQHKILLCTESCNAQREALVSRCGAGNPQCAFNADQDNKIKKTLCVADPDPPNDCKSFHTK